MNQWENTPEEGLYDLGTYRVHDVDVPSFVENRAVQTLPRNLELKQSGIGGGTGVFANDIVPRGTLFGPYQGRRYNAGEFPHGQEKSYLWRVFVAPHKRALKFFVDGKEYTDEDVPMNFAGYTLDRVASLVTESGQVKGTSYILELDGDDYIGLRSVKALMSVDVSIRGNPELENSQGLLGEYRTGKMLARDGKTVLGFDKPIMTVSGKLSDVSNAMGFEWQVRDTDPQLFQQAREPQWPTPCRMPTEVLASDKRRYLRSSGVSLEAAQKACAGKNEDEFDFCVTDVVTLGDLDAAAYW